MLPNEMKWNSTTCFFFSISCHKIDSTSEALHSSITCNHLNRTQEKHSYEQLNGHNTKNVERERESSYSGNNNKGENTKTHTHTHHPKKRQMNKYFSLGKMHLCPSQSFLTYSYIIKLQHQI